MLICLVNNSILLNKVGILSIMDVTIFLVALVTPSVLRVSIGGGTCLQLGVPSARLPPMM